MSKYTTQLRWPVEQEEAKYANPASGSQYHPSTYALVGLDKYPIYDESYRKPLNDKIIDHFYFQEIGFETFEQFRFMMRRTMNEIMPYYNQLYKSLALIKDPLIDHDMSFEEETSEGRTGGSEMHASSTSNQTTNNQNVYSDTPMGMLTNVGTPSIGGVDGDYATNATFDHGGSNSSDESQSASDSHSNMAGTRQHREHGFTKSPSLLLKEYRQNMINVDMEIIGELESLFMGIW